MARPLDPDKAATVTARVPTEVKTWLLLEGRKRGRTLSEQVAFIVTTLYQNRKD